MQQGLNSGLSGFRFGASALQFGGEMGKQEKEENVLTSTCVAAQKSTPQAENGVVGVQGL